ncbi:MAG: TIGR02647 family protein [Chromatocurvus sp.]
MKIDREMSHEMELLLLFDPESLQHGLKIHSDADPAMIAATRRLYDKGLTDQPDGGFLTSLGHEATEHVRALHQILSAAHQTLR